MARRSYATKVERIEESQDMEELATFLLGDKPLTTMLNDLNSISLGVGTLLKDHTIMKEISSRIKPLERLIELSMSTKTDIPKSKDVKGYMGTKEAKIAIEDAIKVYPKIHCMLCLL